MYTNIRSIMGKFAELQHEVAIHKPDLFALAETWLEDSIADPEIQLPGYTVLRTDRINNRHGGVLAYIAHKRKSPLLNSKTIRITL